MAESLSRIFKDKMFETAKDPNRNWEAIAAKAGDLLAPQVEELFPYPEIGICALVNCLADIIILQEDKGVRVRICERLKDALKERIEVIEKEEPDSDDYEFEAEEEETEEDEPKEPERKKGTKPPPPQGPEDMDEEEEEEEEIDPDAEVDYKEENGASLPGEDHRPSDNDEDEGDDDPDESKLEANEEDSPARQAGYRPARRQSRK